MKTVHVFVYGHYDSRGGALALIAPNRVEADRNYCASFGYSDPEMQVPQPGYQGVGRKVDYEVHRLLYPEGAKQLLEQDYLFECDLELPDEYDADEGGELLHAYGGEGEIYALMPKEWYETHPLDGLDDAMETDSENPPLRLRLIPWCDTPKVGGRLVTYLLINRQLWVRTDYGEDGCGCLLWPTQTHLGDRKG